MNFEYTFDWILLDMYIFLYTFFVFSNLRHWDTRKIMEFSKLSERILILYLF